MGPRACEGQLPGGSGIGPPILAHSGGQVTLQLSARQPGQSQTQYLRSGQVSWCPSRAAASCWAAPPGSHKEITGNPGHVVAVPRAIRRRTDILFEQDLEMVGRDEDQYKH